MKKGLQLLGIFLVAILLVWLFPVVSVGVSAPDADVDLRLVKSGSPDPVTAGNVLRYTLAITNTGPSTATGVIASDFLPGGANFQAATPGCAHVAGTVTCNLGDLAASASRLVTITVQVDPALRGSITNTASVTTTDTDIIPGNNSSVIRTSINTSVALALSKNDHITQVTAGDGLVHTYAITVTNTGPSVASSVLVTDTWPTGFTRGTVTNPFGACNTSNPADFTCSLGSLLSGGSKAITAAYTVPSSTPPGTQTNSVVARSPESSAPATTSDGTLVQTRANLTIAKSDRMSQVTAGDGLVHTYAITVTNTGPSVASSVLVTDTWPTGFTRGTVTNPFGACNTSNPADFTCNLGSLLAGGSKTITASYTVPSSTPPGTQTNSVVARSPESSAPATTSDGTLVQTRANLTIAKNDHITQVTAGDGLVHTYAITVTNTGPSVASSVLVTDTWPTGFTRGTVTNPFGACNTSNPADFTCNLGSLLAGGSKTITAAYTVPSSTPPGTLTNSVVARSPESSTPATTSDGTLVQTRANLTIAKSDGVILVIAGSGLTHTYAITVTNTGPSVASSVLVTDTWPTAFTRGAVTNPFGTCNTSNPADFTCNLGSIPVHSSKTVTAAYTVPSATPPGLYTNSVVARSPESPAPASASDANSVSASVGLGIAKNDGVSQVTAGDGIVYTYTILVTNAGPSLATSVVLTDTWPAGFTRGAVTNPAGSCNTSNPMDFTCNLGNIPVNSSRTVTAAYTVPSTTPRGSYTNSVIARSPQTGAPVSTTDVNNVSTSVILAIAKSDGVSQVIAGDGVVHTYAITVTNTGPSVASSVVLTDTWPTGFTRGTVTNPFGACNTSNPAEFTCNFGGLQVGGSKAMTASYTVPPGTPLGTQTNSVAASSPESSAPATSSDGTLVQTRANLSLSKVDNPDPVTAGKILTYTLSVANAGPSYATGVSLTDTLPAGTTFTSAGSSPECTGGTGVVTCNLGVFGVGANHQSVIKVSVNSSVTGTITNHASVTSSALDPNTANNQATTPTAVLAPDLVLPTVTWTSPVSDEETFDVLCQVVRLEVNATDNVQVQRVRFYWWDPGAMTYHDIGYDNTAPYQWDFNTCGLYPKYNQLFAEAYDTSGNISNRKRIFLYRIIKLFMPFVIR